MNILVYNRNSTIISNKNERIIQSKDIICPICGELCLINFKDYKIILNNCKNNHENIILLNEFENSQNINENKIICNICSNNNKGKTYNNQFYICGTCNKNICPLCKEKHNKEHKILDYDNKNYICNKHNDPKAVPVAIINSFKLITTIRGKGIMVIIISSLFLKDKHAFHKFCAVILFIGGIFYII